MNYIDNGTINRKLMTRVKLIELIRIRANIYECTFSTFKIRDLRRMSFENRQICVTSALKRHVCKFQEQSHCFIQFARLVYPPRAET